VISKNILAVVLFCLTTISGYSQIDSSATKNHQVWPIKISYLTHSYSLPFKKPLTKPIQSGLQVGTEFRYLNKNASGLYQSVNIGHFRNTDFLDAYYINSHIVYRYTTPVNVFFNASSGIGYLHRRHTREVFKLNNNGVYESKFDWGKPAFQFGFSIGAGYDFKSLSIPFVCFIKYEWFASTPHISESVPLMGHSLFHIGLGYKLK